MMVKIGYYVVFREYERYEDIKRLAYLLNIMNTVFERYEDIKRVPTSGVLARLLPRKAPLLEWRQLVLFKPKRLSQTLLKIRNAWRGNYWEKFVVVLSSGESSLKSLGGVSRWPGFIVSTELPDMVFIVARYFSRPIPTGCWQPVSKVDICKPVIYEIFKK